MPEQGLVDVLAADDTLRKGVSGLVALPFRQMGNLAQGQFITGTVATGISLGGNGGSLGGIGGWSLSASPSAAPPGGAGVMTVFQGRRAALIATVPVTAKYGVFINGRMTVYADGVVSMRGKTQAGVLNDMLVLPVAEGLRDDGPHTFELILFGDTVVTRTMTPVALMVEERFAPRAYRPVLARNDIAFVPATATAITRGSYNRFRAFTYYNTDSANRIITLKIGGNVWKVFTLVPGEERTVDLGDDLAIDSSWTHECDLASKVRCFVTGGSA